MSLHVIGMFLFLLDGWELNCDFLSDVLRNVGKGKCMGLLPEYMSTWVSKPWDGERVFSFC